MKGIIRGRAAAGAAALGIPLLATALPADAGTADGAIGKVEFTYSSPEVAETGDKVTWHWAVKNASGGSVAKVVLTHRLTPKLKVHTIDKPCTATAASIRCDYGTLKAGERRRGSLVAELPPAASGTVQLNGRVTWHQGATTDQAPAPETKQPETKQPETKQPETKQPETKQPETKQPEATQPETKPETKQPAAAPPAAAPPVEKTPPAASEPAAASD
ncbi:hypothetical protein ACGFNU_30675 [Spirillospora sp. NPDC048911]|uniref:hypothetical protein n=1 Tax=Spirillospora sp. NPDC048911 TaxID=3364527 RepID=UPI00371173EB